MNTLHAVALVGTPSAIARNWKVLPILGILYYARRCMAVGVKGFHYLNKSYLN